MIAQIVSIFYPIYLSSSIYAIGSNSFGEFGLGYCNQQHKLIQLP